MMKSKWMRKIVAYVLAGVMCIGLTACGNQEDSASATNGKSGTSEEKGGSDGVIKIGQIVTSLTGDAAMYGDYQVNAAQMAADEINAKGGINGKKIEIVYLDDQSKPQVALQCMQKLLDEEEPLVVLGPDWSGNTMAAMEAAKKEGVPQVCSSKSREITHSDNPYIFRTVATSHFVGETLANIAKEKGYQKVAIWYTNSEYGVGGSEGAKRACENMGLEVVAHETHNVGDNDFTAQIMNVKNSGAECIINYSIQVEGAKSLKQMREQGLDIPILGGDAFITPDFAKLVGDEYMEGVIATSAFVACDPEQVVVDWVKSYEELYGVTPDDHAAPYYDAVNIIAKVIEEVGEDREAISEGLKDVSGYVGVQGDYTTDEWGNMIHGCKVVEYKSGEWTYVKTMPQMEDYED
ncbi:MAG TPA: ABC transporter substrate-binding protein [Candidatus Pelethocola excrementipullorum]|nr:ABC transporter substrate-binding protein [Candidatus Pelethocola excrementipullorum]